MAFSVSVKCLPGQKNREVFPHWVEKAEHLLDLLTHKTPSGLVVVSVYEWEGGLSD